MPRIILKPNSAEFADTNRKQRQGKTLSCEMPGCSAYAEHKAPKHRGLNEYHDFCFDHVREYNKAWNFFSGMSDTEVNNHMDHARYGHRPTWQYAEKGAAEDILKRKAWQTYRATNEEPDYKNGQYEHERASYSHPGANRNSPEFEALSLMGLEPPVTLADIKTRYKTLAKRHHPDLNQGCPESEELLKHINMAYTILKLAYQQFEKLPEKD